MQWVRLYHDMPTDPKWRVIARKSGQRIGDVIAVWNMMLVNASQASERGTLEGWDDEDAGAALDLDGDDVKAIREAMEGKVLTSNSLTSFEKRNPKRERDDDSSERVRRYREKKRHVTPCNAPDKSREDTEEEKEDGTLGQAEMMVSRWNALASQHGLVSVQKLTDKRKQHALRRLDDVGGLDGWATALDKIRGSPFLRGDNDRKWQVTFDWLMSPNNLAKLMDGNYDSGEKPSGPEMSRAEQEIADYLMFGIKPRDGQIPTDEQIEALREKYPSQLKTMEAG